MTKFIIIHQEYGQGFTVGYTTDAIEQKRLALERASLISKVTNPEEQEAAIAATSVLKGLSKAVEKTREEVKKPYLEACRLIDLRAKEYRHGIDTRATEIERSIADYQQKEREKEQLAMREEAARKWEAEQAAKRAAEYAGLVIALLQKNPSLQKRMELEEAKAQAEIDASEARQEAEKVSVVPEIPKAAGAAIRETFDFEVLNIRAFLKWDDARKEEAYHHGRYAPDFVTIEIKRREFKEYLSVVGDSQPIPGIKIIKQTQAAVRSVAPSIALK